LNFLDQLLINLIGALVIAREFESTFFEMEDPAATLASSPILIGAIKDEFEPINALLPIVVLCLLTPS
jgi:hypothetical protein